MTRHCVGFYSLLAGLLPQSCFCFNCCWSANSCSSLFVSIVNASLVDWSNKKLDWKQVNLYTDAVACGFSILPKWITELTLSCCPALLLTLLLLVEFNESNVLQDSGSDKPVKTNGNAVFCFVLMQLVKDVAARMINTENGKLVSNEQRERELAVVQWCCCCFLSWVSSKPSLLLGWHQCLVPC